MIHRAGVRDQGRYRPPRLRVCLFLFLTLPLVLNFRVAIPLAGPSPGSEAAGELNPVEAQEVRLLLDYETAELARGPANGQRKYKK